MNAKCDQYELKMKKTVEVLKQELQTIRAGRANAAVLNKITVSYYGVDTPIQQIAQISTPEPRVLAIQPWDASTLNPISKAIQASDIGINPQNDGKVIRLIFPQLTEERRLELAKSVKKLAEEAKVAIRNVRRDANDSFKKMQKTSEITEDDLKLLDKDIQTLTDKYCKEIDEEASKKEKEIIEI